MKEINARYKTKVRIYTISNEHCLQMYVTLLTVFYVVPFKNNIINSSR